MLINGRLERSAYSYDQKYPIVIPVNSWFLKTFANHIHIDYFHADIQFLVSYIRSRYWVVGNLIRLVKSIVRACVICIHFRSDNTYSQLMIQLPEDRTSLSRPFVNVGVDFTGSFLVKCTDHRSVKAK